LDDAEHAREISSENKAPDFSGGDRFEQGERPTRFTASAAAQAGGIARYPQLLWIRL
jgi:hypothetical protein